MKKRPTKERELWNFYRTPRGIEEARLNQSEFKRVFPAGHRNSLRRVMSWLGSLNESKRKSFFEAHPTTHLPDAHPSAFSFLAVHGRNYTPIKMKSPPGWGEPQRGLCFLNSYQLMRGANKKPSATPIVYVEGIVVGVMAYPMLHGWNSYGLTDSQALDWTHYAVCQWSRYLGFPLLQTEYEELQKLIGVYKGKIGVSLFLKGTFPKVEARLQEIAAQRP